MTLPPFGRLVSDRRRKPSGLLPRSLQLPEYAKESMREFSAIGPMADSYGPRNVSSQLVLGRPGNSVDSGLGESDEGEIPCPQATNTILGLRREPGGRPSVLDMSDRLGVQVPYR